MATKAMTLSDFLLARIAEDEGEANYVRNVGVRGPQYGSVNGALRHVVDKVLTDAEAKRRIVELHRPIPASDIDWVDCAVCPSHPGVGWPCPTLRALAAVYSDHADYQRDWA